MITVEMNKNGMFQGFLSHNGKKFPLDIEGIVKANVVEVVEVLKNAIYRQHDDMKNNFGLAFYECGYDGNAQNALNDWTNGLGVEIF